MIRTNHDLADKTWFVTFTCYDWLPLFDITASYYLVYNWLKLIDNKYHIECVAFVIMPNHVHLIVHLPESVTNLNTIISNGKRFIAYELISLLKSNGHNLLSIRLAGACSEKEQLKGQLHKVFEPSFDAKPIYSLEFMNQKLDYIHHNPVSGKWNLCTEFTDYPHSSAAFYFDGKDHPYIDILDYREFW